MRYTLKQLRYIDMAARHKSITGASAELNISPSSISAAIDALELELKRKIFRRLPSKGIQPTQFGHTFLGNARQLLKAHTSFEDAVEERVNVVDGAIRMGCFTPAAPILLPLIARAIADDYPGISLHFIEGEGAVNMQRVAHSDIDLALGFNAEIDMNIKFVPLFEAPPHIILPAGHRLATRKVLRLKDVAGEPMVLLDLVQTRDYMFGLFAQDGLTPKVAYSSKSSEMVRSMVASGLGYSVFNLRPSIKQQYAMGDLVRIPLAAGYRSVEFGILHRYDAVLSRVEQVLLDTCLRLRDKGVFQNVVLNALD